MKKKLFLFLILISAVSSAHIYPQNKSENIYGNWESPKSRGNYVDMIQLKKDGTYIRQSVAASDYKYKISGDTLITSLQNAGKDTTIIDTSLVKIKKDTLVNTYVADGKETQFNMIRQDKKQINIKNIAGTYIWKYPNGRYALSHFTKNGELFFRLPAIGTTGKFSTNKSIIVFHRQYIGNEKKIFWHKGNILILIDPKTKEEVMYRRVDYFLE